MNNCLFTGFIYKYNFSPVNEHLTFWKKNTQDTICIENDNTNISSTVKNPTKCLYNIDKVDSENIYELVENTVILSGAIKNKETDPDNVTKNSTQQIWDKHFKWSKEENSDFKNKIKKMPVPYAITSSKWMQIQKEKEDKKLAKETLSLEIRNARLMKKIETENKRKSKEINKVPIKKPKVINSKDVTNLEKTNFEAQKIKKTLNVGDYVVVIYEGEYFPGVIKSIKKTQSQYKVKAMAMSGRHWKWPELDDLCWFNKNEIIEKIATPKFVADLSIDAITYSVPEIELIKQINVPII